VPGAKFESGEDIQRGRPGRIGTIFVLDNKKDVESYIAENSHLSDSEIFYLVLNEVTKDDSGVVKWAPDEGPATYEYGDGYGSGPYRK
jgi:hypothetical protein